MAKNQVIDPRADYAFSIKAGSSDTPYDPVGKTGLGPGTPVVKGHLCGVAITALETANGGTTGVVNSNAPGNVTVWAGGEWNLPVTVTGGNAKQGDLVYATPSSNKIAVVLKNAGAKYDIPVGVLMQDTADGTGAVRVKLFPFALDALSS